MRDDGLPVDDSEFATHPEMDPQDYTLPGQYWEEYTQTDHNMWNTLFRRQTKIIPDLAHPDFVEYVRLMDFDDKNGIPRFESINEKLSKATNWVIVPVPGLIPTDVFFGHLSQRRFPVTYWMRPPEKADYLPEPDLFHDLYGHVPMLMNPYVADYIQAYGRGGLKAMKHPYGLKAISRLYWFTIEFGLVNTEQGPRVYGAGILSSKEECQYSVHSPRPHRLKFDIKRMMRTNYDYFDLQKTYFVIDSFEQLVEETKPDFMPYYDEVKNLPEIDPKTLQPEDEIVTRGQAIEE